MGAILPLLTFLSLLAWFTLCWHSRLMVFSDIRAALANRQARIVKTYEEGARQLLQNLPGDANYTNRVRC